MDRAKNNIASSRDWSVVAACTHLAIADESLERRQVACSRSGGKPATYSTGNKDIFTSSSVSSSKYLGKL